VYTSEKMASRKIPHCGIRAMAKMPEKVKCQKP